MDKRKIGFTILILSLVLGAIFINLIGDSQKEAKEAGCFDNSEECKNINYTLSISHLSIGLLFALLSLGIYLIIFGRTEEELIKQLKEQKAQLTKEQKLNVIRILLSENEKKIFDTVNEHEGITQSTLKIKTNLSKATVSQILSDFEKKDLIVRVVKGKTYSIHLKRVF